jgi:hypothetical protein
MVAGISRLDPHMQRWKDEIRLTPQRIQFFPEMKNLHSAIEKAHAELRRG